MSAPVFGYYGKLPVSREFLRLHAAGPELRELDEWFERGVQYAKSTSGPDWPALLAQADIWNFLFVPEGNGRVVCGAIFASRDQAGRSFPFLTFLLIERNDLLPPPWLIPLTCREFLARTRQLLQQLRTDLDWNAFRVSVESLPSKASSDASIADGFEDYLSHTTISEFLSRTYGKDDQELIHRLSHDCSVHLNLRGKRTGAGTVLGFKSPLVQEDAAEFYDLPFWFYLHACLHNVRQEKFPPLIAFWNRTPSKVAPCLLVSFGRSSPNLTRFLVSPNAKDDAWYELEALEMNPQQSVLENSPDNSAQIAAIRDISLRRYLDMIG